MLNKQVELTANSESYSALIQCSGASKELGKLAFSFMMCIFPSFLLWFAGLV
jgi:hypothetical protein